MTHTLAVNGASSLWTYMWLTQENSCKWSEISGILILLLLLDQSKERIDTYWPDLLLWYSGQMPSVDKFCLTLKSQTQCGKGLHLASSVWHNLYPGNAPPYSPDVEKLLPLHASTGLGSCVQLCCVPGRSVVRQYAHLEGDTWVIHQTTCLHSESGQLLHLVVGYQWWQVSLVLWYCSDKRLRVFMKKYFDKARLTNILGYALLTTL